MSTTEERLPLIPLEMLEKLPKLGTTAGLQDLAPAIKLVLPDIWINSAWAWYVTEGSPDEDEKPDWLLFGLVIGIEKEWGYFSLKELSEVRGPLGKPIERDLYFDGVIPQKDLP